MTDHVLDLQGISHHFGAIQALSGVDLALSRGEVLGLMGDNGAGKSTLVKIIAGNFAPSGGTIVLDGEEVRFHSPLDARRHGIETRLPGPGPVRQPHGRTQRLHGARAHERLGSIQGP